MFPFNIRDRDPPKPLNQHFIILSEERTYFRIRCEWFRTINKPKSRKQLTNSITKLSVKTDDLKIDYCVDRRGKKEGSAELTPHTIFGFKLGRKKHNFRQTI